MNEITIYHLGNSEAVSYKAAERARLQVAKYVELTEGGTVDLESMKINGFDSQEQLKSLIELGNPHYFFVIPLSNNVAGDVSDFMEYCEYPMIGELSYEFQLVLCNRSGDATKIQGIVTKNTALEQCRDDLSDRGFDVEALNKANEQPTSEGISRALADESLAALCLPDACGDNGLLPVGKPFVRCTTFGIFVNEPKSHVNAGVHQTEYHSLLENARLIAGNVVGGGRLEFAQRLMQGEKLTVKWGIDPLNNKLHLGHLACLYKLNKFREFGHSVVIVLGTFTGAIGDPSGNLKARPRYQADDLEANAEFIKRQIVAILGEEGVRFVKNRDIVSKMTFEQLLRWGYDIDHRMLMGRSDFVQRVNAKKPLSLSEILYGLFQAHDTLIVDADVELAGVDQLHNGVLMRNIFRLESRPAPFLMLLPVLPGIDRRAKMSAFAKNEILVTAPRDEIRNSLLKMDSKEHILQYARTLTLVDEVEIHRRETALGMSATTLPELSKWMADALLERLEPSLESLAAS